MSRQTTKSRADRVPKVAAEPDRKRKARSVSDSSQERVRPFVRPEKETRTVVRYGPFGREEVRMQYVAGRLDDGRPGAQKNKSTDARMRNDLPKIRAESQRLDQDNLIFSACISRFIDVANGGDGPVVRARSGDAEYDAWAQAKWDAFWLMPESRGIFSGPEFCDAFVRHVAIDGDALVHFDDDIGKLNLYVGEQLASDDNRNASAKKKDNLIEQGVELDEFRRPVNFRVRPFDAYGNIVRGQRVDIPAEECEFFAHRRRVDQTRGEPMGQQTFPMVHRINDVCDSEAAAWQVLSRMAVAITADRQSEQAFENSQVDGRSAAGSITNRVQDLGLALIFNAQPGEKVEGIDRNIPGANFVESLKAFLRLLGMAFGMSLEFVLLIWSDTNYASGRMSVKQVERNCRKIRKWIKCLVSRAYKWHIARCIKDENYAVPDKIDPLKHTIEFLPFPSADPGKERDAQVTSLESGLSSPQREVAATGDNFDEILAERTKAFGQIAEAIKIHNAKFPDNPELHLKIADFTPRKDTSAPALSQPTVLSPPQGDQNAVATA